MNKGGLIIRLIDVAMIILFGFIAISDIKVRAQIRLPSQEENKIEQNEEEPVLLFVKVDLEQGYVVEENEQTLLTTRELGRLEATLLARLRENRAAGRKMVVLVEPDEDSQIQETVNVLDICERNEIPKNINYESLQF